MRETNMACANRFPRVLRVSPARRPLPGAYAARRPDGVYGVYGKRRRANGSRAASRAAVACRTGWPAFDADDACASESPS
jgi:hypothetical protein